MVLMAYLVAARKVTFFFLQVKENEKQTDGGGQATADIEYIPNLYLKTNIQPIQACSRTVSQSLSKSVFHCDFCSIPQSSLTGVSMQARFFRAPAAGTKTAAIAWIS